MHPLALNVVVLALLAAVRPVAALDIVNLHGFVAAPTNRLSATNASSFRSALKSVVRSSQPARGPDGQHLLPIYSAGLTPVVALTVGNSSATQLFLLIDTGSDISWVRSSICFLGNDCKPGQRRYILPADSPHIGVMDIPNSRTIRYNDGGMVMCVNVNDTVAFGTDGLSDQTVCAAFFSEKHCSIEFDGVIGLSTTDAQEPTNIIHSFLAAHHPDDQKISFWFNPDTSMRGKPSNSTTNSQPTLIPNAGEVALGKPNAARFQGPIAWSNMTSDVGSWKVLFESITIGNETFPVTNASTAAMVDTGSSLVRLEKSLFNAVQSAMGGQVVNYMIVVDCNKIDSLPPITFALNGASFTIPPRQQIVVADNGRCTSIFKQHPKKSNTIGASFMYSVYTVFDLGTNRVGFAQLADAPVDEGQDGIEMISVETAVSSQQSTRVIGWLTATIIFIASFVSLI